MKMYGQQLLALLDVLARPEPLEDGLHSLQRLTRLRRLPLPGMQYAIDVQEPALQVVIADL
jgi:hypothetical protein